MANEQEITLPSAFAEKLGSTSSVGYVGEEKDLAVPAIATGDLTAEEMTAKMLAETEAKEKAEAEEGAQGSEVDEVELDTLKTKFETTPDDISEEERNKLIEAGILEDVTEIENKLEELSKKEEKDLTDDEKQFIADNTEEPDLVNVVRNTFKEDFGIDLEGDYSNDTEGLKKVVIDSSKKQARTIFENHINSVPEFADFYQHVVIDKKSIDTYKVKQSQADYSNVKLIDSTDSSLEEKDVEEQIKIQKDIIKSDFLSRGLDEEAISTIIEKYEDTGVLFDKAKTSQASKKEAHAKFVAQTLAEEQEAINAENIAIEREWKTIASIIDSNDLGGSYKIAPKDLVDFRKAVLEPVDENGNTKMDYLRNELMKDPKNKVLNDYLIYKKFNLLDKQVTPNKGTALKFRLAKKENDDRGGRKVSGKSAAQSSAQNGMKLANINFNTINK
jgi:hypothetical protein